MGRLSTADIQALASRGFYIVGEVQLTDDTTNTGGQDRKRVSLSQDHEVRDWVEKFGVSEDRLRAAVERVGPMADDVERELQGG